MSHKIAQLSLSPSTKSAVASDIFVAQPDSIKEELAGKLFVLVELEQNNSTAVKIINFLIDTINHHYYQNEKILLRERVSTLKVEHIFEAALAKSNKLFSEFLNAEKINLTADTINITVGVVHENNLHFANSGKNKVLLVYEAPVTTKTGPSAATKGEYKTVDVTKQANPENPSGAISKLFSNVVSGPIPKGGSVLISNEALPEYISNKRLMQIVTTLPPVGAVEQIKNTLSAINAYVSFSAIVIRNTINDFSPEQPIAVKRSTAESIVNLNRTEESTENLLTPSGLINFKKWLHFFTNFNSGDKKAAQKNYESRLNLKDQIFVKKKTSNTARQILSIVRNIFVLSFKALAHGFSLFSQKNKLADLKTTLQNSSKNKLDRFFSAIFNLSAKSKILIVAGIFLLIFFVYNLSIIKTNIEVEQQQEDYQEITALIEQKQNQAEASLLYSNEGGAKNLFDEIKGLMDTLPQETDEQKQKYNEFNQKFNQHMETIRRMIRLEPEEVADFSNLNNQADPDNITFIADKNKIYSADSKQKSIYILDIADRLITTITDLSLPINSLSKPTKNKENQIYYLNDNNIIEFAINDEQLKLVPFSPENKGVFSTDVYNDRLYVLNPTDNSLFRYNRGTTEFNTPYRWMSADNNLSGAIDLAIDGYVYILFADGRVEKYLKGEETVFHLGPVDPPLTTADKIFVSAELDYLYILDSSQNRLIIFDKSGKFNIQYTADQFNDLRDFQVNEANGDLFFLNGNQVFQASTDL